MTTAVARTIETPAAILERVVIGGDLSGLSSQERVTYYAKVCESVGLNPLTQPFEYLQLKKKVGDEWKKVLILYAKKDATDQLRAVKGISVKIVARDVIGDVYIVTSQAVCRDNKAVNGLREDESTGAVSIAGLNGEALANAYMKAETKSKRRVTLSISGLGMLDESELEDLDPDAGFQQAEERPVVRMPQPLSAPKDETKVDESMKIKPGQVRVLQKALDRSKVSAEALCKQFGIEAMPDLPFVKINPALSWISEQAKE